MKKGNSSLTLLHNGLVAYGQMPFEYVAPFEETHSFSLKIPFVFYRLYHHASNGRGDRNLEFPGPASGNFSDFR